ncbi:hypothetical protein MASR2M15_21980 [Anaerolineales bacterium]
MKIAFATYKTIPELTPSDAKAAQALNRLGVEVDACVWDDPRIQWGDYQAVILRSTWDYHQSYQVFINWLNALEIPVFNPIEMLRWNYNKIYLKELAENRDPMPTPVITSAWYQQGQEIKLDEVVQTLGTDDLVIKPTISAGAANTKRIQQGAEWQQSQNWANELLATRDLIVQAFAPEIRQGEYSFLYFDGIFSHAVQKIPPEAHIFVQEEHGGSTQVFLPEAALLEQCQAYIDVVSKRFGEAPLYARVDCIIRDGCLYLMELELIEPELYFYVEGVPESAAVDFAKAIIKRLC